MKTNKIYLLGLTFALLVAAGCTDGFEDLNKDKNNANADAYNPSYHLSRAQLEYSGNSDFSYEMWRVNIIYAGMMMQQLANTSWYAGDKYIQNDGWAASLFDVAYNDQVKYVVDLIKITEGKEQYHNIHQIGRIMRALVFHRITDVYGDVPYSQAGLGYLAGILTPEYDKQEDIYKNMLKELDEAAAALDPAKDVPGSADLMYGDDGDNVIPRWKKFGYSLMLRLAMRLVKVDNATAKLYAEKAATGGVFASNADNAFIVHNEGGGRPTRNRNSNILAGEWNATDWGVTDPTKYKNEVFLSQTFVDFLADNDDPRLQYIARLKSGSTDPDDQIGMPNGYDTNTGATDIKNAPNYPGTDPGAGKAGNPALYSTIRGDIFLSLSGPTFFLTYAQTEFLLAEAIERGYSVGGTAQDHYNKGVRAAMEQLAQYNAAATISSTDINDYLAGNPYLTGGTLEQKLEQINTQYWAASFLDWIEAWSNWRRTGYPVLTPVDYTGNATNGQIPRRMMYPSSEAAINGDNFAAAIGRQGANNFTTRVWWDKP